MADERGKVSELIQSAASAEELRGRFIQNGFHVYSVKPRGIAASLARKKVGLEPFLIFNQQFLTLIRAGLPILGSLEMMAKNQKNAAFASQLENIAARVRTGESLSAAFEAQGGFPVIYTTTLLAGERSGNLNEVLERYVSFQRISLTLRKKLVASLIYPTLLITMVIALLIFLITFVVPRFAMLYDQMGGNLPTVTRMLLDLGKGMQHYFFYGLGTLILVVYLFLRYTRTQAGAERIDSIRIGMPIFGLIWLKYQVALFSRTLSTLLSGGLPLVPSLETAARSISSRRIAQSVFDAVVTVREGKSLAESLTEAKVFPLLSTEMMFVGEQTGALPAMLNSVAEFYEEDVQNALTAALALIEPVILIVMGVAVVIILMALYLPIFSIGSAAQMAH
jgi:type IV pilus assembly protein PilC